MSEVLWGVVIGGIVGNISGIATLWFSYNKWKKELKLSYLKDERQRLENLFNELYDPITSTMYTGIINPKIRGKLLMFVPHDVEREINNYLDEGIKADDKRRNELLELIGNAMKKPLDRIENKIKLIISN